MGYMNEVCRDMVTPVSSITEQQVKIPIYILREDWMLDCEGGINFWIFADDAEARQKFNEKLAAEIKAGTIHSWLDNNSYMAKYDQDKYECWIDGEYMSNHYKLSIAVEMLSLPSGTVGDIWRVYQNRGRFEDFISEVEQWEELADFSDEEYQQFISDTRIPGLIDDKLGSTYWEGYWEAVSEAAGDLLREYQKKKAKIAA